MLLGGPNSQYILRKRGTGAVHGWGDWEAKEWLPGIHEHEDQQYLSGSAGLLEREQQPRWQAFWWLFAEDVVLLGNKVSDLPTSSLCSQKESAGMSNFLKFD
jgi:hypothetical protein